MLLLRTLATLQKNKQKYIPVGCIPTAGSCLSGQKGGSRGMVRGMGVDPCLVSGGGRGGGGMVRAVRWCMRSVINKATIKNFFCYFHYQRICIKKKFSVVCVCPWGSHTRRLGPMSDWKRTPLTHSDKPFSRVFCNIPKHNSQRKERERKSSLVWFHACGQAFLLLRLLSSCAQGFTLAFLRCYY